jgi:RND family efflux transporter MFP subunit
MTHFTRTAAALAALAAAGALAAGTLAFAANAFAADGQPAARATGAPVTAPTTAVAQRRVVPTYYVADAAIEAVRQATVSAQIAGQVTHFFVDAGDRVKRGQVLARIDSRDVDAQAAAGSAQVAQAQANLAAAQLSYDRSANLVQQNFLSQAALDKADAELKTARAGVEVARATQAQSSTARGYSEVRAPIDGVVTRRLIELGELAQPGKPILELHDPQALRAVGSVPQMVLASVKAAPQVPVRVELPTLGRSVTAVRTTVLPASDARLLSTQVRAELPLQLPAGVVPGVSAKLWLPTGQAEKLVVPVAAVVRRGELTAAYVVQADGRSLLRQLRVGEAADGQVEVLAGLEEGERVALDPLQIARP